MLLYFVNVSFLVYTLSLSLRIVLAVHILKLGTRTLCYCIIIFIFWGFFALKGDCFSLKYCFSAVSYTTIHTYIYTHAYIHTALIILQCIHAYVRKELV